MSAQLSSFLCGDCRIYSESAWADLAEVHSEPLLISPPILLSPHPYTYSPTKHEGKGLGFGTGGPGTGPVENLISFHGMDLSRPGENWLPPCIMTLRCFTKAALGQSCEHWERGQGP